MYHEGTKNTKIVTFVCFVSFAEGISRRDPLGSGENMYHKGTKDTKENTGPALAAGRYRSTTIFLVCVNLEPGSPTLEASSR